MEWLELVSAREAEVLAAIRAHQSNAQIAARLHLSIRTVESHVASLLRKAGVPDRRSLAALADEPVSDLPVFPTSFVGRSAERTAVLAALGDSRLVSLVGAGGMGKTRLAVEAAAGQDAVFVDLVPVRAGGVGQAVAQALGVVERPPGTPADAVVERLRSARTLLVLDNCEHVINEVGELVARILRVCPQVRLLATSRERLAVPGERLVEVGSLGAEAPRLFLERATDPAVDLSVVSRLCTALDGMPLAIELVAARSASLGVDGLEAALDDLLRLISGGRGPDQRHHSLSDVLGWSLDLLSDEERLVFRRLGVFVGGFDLPAVVAVTGELGVGAVADLIGRLVDRSLVVHRRVGTTTRWSLLETVRAVALHELQTSGEDLIPPYVRWAANTAADLETRIDQLPTPEFDAVAADLRNALTHTTPDSYRLAKSLAHLSFARGLLVAARNQYVRAADLGERSADDLELAAAVALTADDGATAFELLLRASDRAEGGTARATALGLAVVAATRFSMSFEEPVARERLAGLLDEACGLADDTDARCVAVLAMARAWASGATPLDSDLELAQTAVAAARRTGDSALVLGALDALGTALANAGRLRQAHRLSDERLRLAANASPHEPAIAAELVDLLHAASTAAIAAGDLPAAASIAARDSSVRTHPAIITPRLIRLYGLSGRFEEALEQADILWDAWLSSTTVGELSALRGDWPASAAAIVAMVHGLRGDIPSYEEWRARACRIAHVDDPADSLALAAPAAFVDARVAVQIGRYDDARRLVDAALKPFAEKWWLPYAYAAGAELAVVAGLPDAAEVLAAAESSAAENDWAAACLTRARARHTNNPQLLADAVTQWTRIDATFERTTTLALADPPAPLSTHQSRIARAND